ncbi:MAG: GNAT family N-acetyltransferase [Methylobacteriaceae bacterium]|nr:GNAT family N-acetyltransferase [Methylobacteriaceae bacterium]
MRQRLRLETKVDHLAPGEVEFRPLAASDFPTLTAWLLQPHVRRFYQKKPITLEEVALEYGPPVRGEEPTICHLALSSGVPFAYLQCYRNADYPEWVAIIELEDGISVDLFIGDAGYVGRGFGRAALGGYLRQVAFPHYTFETRAYIGHELTNKVALRCSLAVGFLPLRPFVEDGSSCCWQSSDRH